MSDIQYRDGTPEDAYLSFQLFSESFADLSQRLGFGSTYWGDAEAEQSVWQRRESLYTYLASETDRFVIAEENGRSVGFARSLKQGEVRQLTEFFVIPSVQSAGVGREMLRRVFPDDTPYRSIIATTDLRAQARYLKSGVTPRFPFYYFGKTPQRMAVTTDLTIAPLDHTEATRQALTQIDQTIWGFPRSDHSLLQTLRRGMGYWRNGQLVGYGYLNRDSGSGPFALLNSADFPAILAHTEDSAAIHGDDHLGFEVPTINQTAVQHLLQHGFQIDRFFAFFMCNQPFGKLENTIITSPPFFL